MKTIKDNVQKKQHIFSSKNGLKTLGISADFAKTPGEESLEALEKIGPAQKASPAQAAANDDPVDIIDWNTRARIPDGQLDLQDRERLREQKKRARTVSRAFARSETTLGRSHDQVRKALAALYLFALELRDHPELVREIMRERRISATPAVRRNIFLAATKICLTQTAADTQNRYAGALAYCADQGRKSDEVPAFLKETGIRASADAWKEIRLSKRTETKKQQPPKPDPIADLRARSVAIPLPKDCPAPGKVNQPFLLVAEHTDGGVVAYQAVSDARVVLTAIRTALRELNAAGNSGTN